MKPFIRILRQPYEEPYHVNLVVAASNGRVQSEIEIYAHAKDLTTLAQRLRGFATKNKDAILWELGSEGPADRFAFYFRMRVVQLTTRGDCFLELRFNNNGTPPNREVTEFSIRALPSDLDRLAGLMEQFGRLEHQVLEWNVTDGSLRESV